MSDKVMFKKNKVDMLEQQSKNDRLVMNLAVRVDHLENELASALEALSQKQHEIKQLTMLAEFQIGVEKDLKDRISGLLIDLKQTQVKFIDNE